MLEGPFAAADGPSTNRTSKPAMKERSVIVKVSNLTKRFYSNVAVNAISFEVDRGETLGFLGPNGAGKSTTMRILAGYLAATDGTVLIDGHDILEHSLEIRKRIGYLPENVALYPEMRVNEYLRFRAQLKGVRPRRLRNRLDEVKTLCGLHEVSGRIIGRLSRGYHQRVGLADALIHEPQLLLLDEPTIGLDPNQIMAIRNLVKTLGERYTIILSTHFLSEAEAICNRVLILNHGKIAASDSPAVLTTLLTNKNVVVAEIDGPRAEVDVALQSIPGIKSIASNPCHDAGGEVGWHRYAIDCDLENDLRSVIPGIVVRRGWQLRELKLERNKLEDVFAEITGNIHFDLK